MRILSISSQSRRDFTATFVCQHCEAQTIGRGYDDQFFHERVIPAMICNSCGKTAPVDYVPLSTKYAEGEVV
jgi:hypothetical protein